MTAALDSWIRRYLDRVVNTRDAGAVDELVSPAYVGSGQGWPADRQRLREFYAWQAAVRPDWRIDVQETIEVDPWVAVRAHASGTVAHDEAGQPLAVPHHRAVEWLAAFRIADGLLVETRLLGIREV